MNELERAVGKQQEELDWIQTLVENKKGAPPQHQRQLTTLTSNITSKLTNILENTFSLFSILYGFFLS